MGRQTSSPAPSASSDATRGGAWVLEGELVARGRQLPGWRRSFPFFLPGAVVFALLALVAAYFGIPTALLNAMAIALGLAHVWPTWRAREVAEYWTPLERYLGVTLSEGGMRICSAGTVHELAVTEIRRVARLPEGWFFWFGDRPPLWLPRDALGEVRAEAVDAVVRGLPARATGAWLPWAFFVAGGASVAGTAFWYLSA